MGRKSFKFMPLVLLAALCAGNMRAQTDVSLFWRSDSVQIGEIITPEADQYKKVGHHGPAIENMYMGLRIYFNNSGSIDVYSKQKPQLELASAHWYPTEKQQKEEGYGCDEYKVGKTVGLGGINLWDGEKALPLTATLGREVRVAHIKGGSTAEMLAKGVPYKGKTVDILIRITMYDNERWAYVEGFSKKGGRVQFVTGVNFHPGNSVNETDNGHIAVWAKHPADVSQNPIPIGGGMVYNPLDFEQKKVTEDAILLVSPSVKHIRTKVVSAGSREAELNTAEAFIAYVKSLKY